MTITDLVRIIWSVSAAGLIIFVLLHSPKGDGLGGIGGQSQLFTSAKSAEKTLNRITWMLFVVFISLTVVLSANWLSFAADPDVPPAPPVDLPVSAPVEVPRDLSAPTPDATGETPVDAAPAGE
nr:preprotein translocase subunit SecG [Prochlorothrix hollandica]